MRRTRAAADLLLVAGAMAMALGLGGVAASLAPFPGDRGDFTQDRPAMVMARGDASGHAASGDDPAGPPTASGNLASGSAFDALPSVSATGPWKSPLYPKVGVTVWDRIRVSSQRDVRAYLVGTAIQVHAPKAAATPGPQYAFPHPHGVD